MSSNFIPVASKAFFDAGTGPMPIILGSQPENKKESLREEKLLLKTEVEPASIVLTSSYFHYLLYR